jgi:isoleucyl-tRNA synthetase
VQAEEFQRLGVIGDWENPYTTMAYAAEAKIVEECLKFLMNGSLYRGARPVMWSVVEKTALAEAEVEYHDHTSDTIHVRFPVITPGTPELEGASIVIWTTTPWTMAGNRAICYGPQMLYRLIEVTEITDGSMALIGEKIVVVDDLLEDMCQQAGIAGHKMLSDISTEALAETICAHPWRGEGYDFDVPVLPGDHVTPETGTGFVHTAPGHGAEDYEVGVEFKLEIPQTVGPDGLFFDHVPLLAGVHVFKANKTVIEALTRTGKLLANGKLVHSYPHSWRSKAPLIFRNTPQWFISMEKTDLREKALTAIDQVRWVPGAGRNRIHAMIADRPDWVISRQRAWGVPITLFVNKHTGEPLQDVAVNQRIVDAIRAGGADAWFESDDALLLGNDYDIEDYEKVGDILDVWFDSGCTHSFVLEDRDDLQWPASLYLEGSDQHRGWFHSSLLESCGTRGRAPYDAVLTHGFTMDQNGHKMSKSLGNTVAPQEICDQFGADILRQWVVSTDYAVDQLIGPDIIKAQVDAYRKLRNTLRFLLGNLAEFEESERLDRDEMPELDRWVLHRLSELDELVRQCVHDFDFHKLFVALQNFCTIELSSFYFDIRKDALYCDAKSSIRRRATRTVLDQVFSCLTAWLAPILTFTTEEAWLNRTGDAPENSVHRRVFPDVPAGWRDDQLAARWNKIRNLRRVVTGALEVERREKRLGASLQGCAIVHTTADHVANLEGVDLAEIAITSDAVLKEGTGPIEAFRLEGVEDVAVEVKMAEGSKCERCWQVLDEVGADDSHPDLCRRCSDAVKAA